MRIKAHRLGATPIASRKSSKQTSGAPTQDAHAGGLRDFHEKPGYMVRRMQQISTALFAEECAQHDLTAVQYAALVSIGLHPEIDATRISRLISLDRSTLGSVLERIEAKGLVHRTASPTDRRIKLLHLSKIGKELLIEVESAVQRVQDKLLEPLTVPQRKQLLHLLRMIMNKHQDLQPIND